MGQDESMVVAAPESIGLDPTQMRRAREVLREHVDSGRSPGLVAIVVRRGEVALAETLGVRDADHHPMEFDTTFPIASATKPLTATVIMSLVEEGRVGLMQRVADYLPELPAALRDGLLIHHLLTHTGGYEAVTWNGRLKARLHERQADDAGWGRDRLVNAYLGCIPELEVIKPPGAAMVYANLGYEMLGEIIRRVTGQSVGDQMRTRIFEPLDMSNTAMCAVPELRTQMVGPMPGVPGFSEMSSLMVGIDGDEILTYDCASGGVVSTPADYATFGRMFLAGGTLHGERVLSRASVTAMTTNQIPGVPDLVFGSKDASWGYGFSVLGFERWPYFGGGLVPRGTARHAGAGGIDHWFDFDNDIVGVCFELVTEISPMLEPISAIGHRFQDVITAAVVD